LVDLEWFRNVLMPFMYQNALVPQLSNAHPAMPGTGAFSQSRIPVGDTWNHADLIPDSEFIGIITHRLWNQNDVMTVYSDLKATLEKLILAIDEELVD